MGKFKTLMIEKMNKDRQQDFKEDWKRIRELSEYSLEHPLTKKEYKEMMGLAKKVNYLHQN